MKTIAFTLVAALFVSGIGLYIFDYTHTHEEGLLPTEIRIGVLPDETGDVLQKKMAPFCQYLSEKMGVKTVLYIPENYEKLVEAFSNKKIEIAYFGGLTYIHSHLKNQSEPLVMREVDTRFTSTFLAKKDLHSKNITDFKGQRFSFGSKLSTSGHLMPRYYMGDEFQIQPDNYFSDIIYSGSHDKTALLVSNGDVDLGVANTEIVNMMFEDGRLDKNEVIPIWVTPPYTDYVWAVQGYLHENTKIQLRNAFLQLSENDPQHKAILSNMGARGFLPASNRDFELLQRIAQNLKLLETDP